MGYLLRRTRKTVWLGGGRSREDAVHEFERREQDTDGLSLFEAENDADRLTVAAAVACERGNCSRVDFIEVERAEIEKYGVIASTPEKGTTPLADANRLHRSLDWEPEQLRRLAEELFDAGAVPREFSPGAIRSAVRSLDTTSVAGETAQEFVRTEKAKAAKP